MTYLPDVNVWIALAVAQHLHHKQAVKWIDTVANDSIAFCRVTKMGFLRLLTNERVMADDVFTAEQAWQLVERVCRDPRVSFTTEPLDIETPWRILIHAFKTGSSYWTDSYLAAFVQAAGHTLVTFDKGFSKHKKISVQILT